MSDSTGLDLLREPYTVRAMICRNAVLLSEQELLPKKHAGALVGYLNKHCGGDLQRQIVLGWLFDYTEQEFERLEPKSSKTLTVGQWLALNKWLDPAPDEGGGWGLSPFVVKEIENVARLALGVYERVSMLVHDELLPYPPLVSTALQMGGEVTQITDEPESLIERTRFGKTRGGHERR